MSDDHVRKLPPRPRLMRSSALQRPAALQLTISHQTIDKILNCLFPPVPIQQQSVPATAQREPSLRPTLKPWIGVINQLIEEDAGLPKRYRTTAMRILKKLREQHGYTGGYTTVQEYVRQARAAAGPNSDPGRKSKNDKRPSQPPAEAETPPRNPSMDATSLPSGLQQSGRSLIPSTWRLSLHPQRTRGPEELVFEWMRGVLQGSVPLDVLAKEISGVPLEELESLRSAATNGERALRNKSLAVLAYLRGISCAPICSFLHISQSTLFNHWRLFRQGGTRTLLTRKTRSDKKSCKDSIKNAVFAVLHSPPSEHGINRTSWRMADLKRILSEQSVKPVSGDVIRTIIKEAGYKWRHARIVLTSNDPDYRAKVDAIKKILSELREDEAFFSIDEYGPFAIKQKGGVKRVGPREQYVVPQWQKSKGWLILTAALELSRNQVSYFYSRKKNTEEMIKMADHLRNEYRDCRTIYLSWDAASWHVSKDLYAHLETVNEHAAVDRSPIVKTAPLPACAQFLNVIESVFSGMARAIMHNSDYPSVEAAKEAIDRYFKERNAHYSENPQRAGQKIWGKERVPCAFEEGQNCKDPLYQYPM